MERKETAQAAIKYLHLHTGNYATYTCKYDLLNLIHKMYVRVKGASSQGKNCPCSTAPRVKP